jgi:hypothetical protein
VAQILLNQNIVNYASSILGAQEIQAGLTVVGDPTFGQSFADWQDTATVLSNACTFDRMSVSTNAQAFFLNGNLTVTLEWYGGASEGSGLATTLNGFGFLTTTNGSVAVPAGSLVWLQITGTALANLANPTTLLNVATHCH